VGGDHSISLAVLRAILVQLDAHCDTGDDYLGSRFHHGAPFRRAVEEVIDPKRTIQIGIRGSLSVRSRRGADCSLGVGSDGGDAELLETGGRF